MLPPSVLAVLAITLGLPFLALLALVSSGSGTSLSILTVALSIAIFSVFVMLMIFEIRRIAELPPDAH